MPSNFDPVIKKNKSIKTTDIAVFFVLLLSAIVMIQSCGGDSTSYSGEAWEETALAALGGTLLATEGNIHLVSLPPKKPASLLELLEDMLIPINIANAETECSILDDSIDNSTDPNIVCESDGTLKIFYHNCRFPNRSASHRGYWRSHSRFLLPSQTICNDLIKANPLGFATNPALVNQTVTRHFGLHYGDNPGQEGDEQNYRINTNGIVTYMGTWWPSGWYDSSPRGGFEVTFKNDSGTFVREVNIKGLHVTHYWIDVGEFSRQAGASYDQIKNGDDFNIDELAFDTESGRAGAKGDQTVDTQTVGTSGSGFSQEDIWEHVNSGDYDPIVVTGTGRNKTITSFKARIQHNLSETVVIAKKLPQEVIDRFAADELELDSRALSWTNDGECCWPTQGEILTNFYHTENMKNEVRSSLARFTPTCGEIYLRYYEGLNALSGLNEDNPQLHQLTYCY